MRYVRVRTEDARGDRLSTLDEFHKAIAATEAGTVSHVLEWKGENALRAEAFLQETRLLPGFLEDVAGLDEAAMDRHLQKPEDAAAAGHMAAEFEAAIGCSTAEGVALAIAVLRLREERERLTRHLCGEGWSFGGSGPWSHNSTNAIANVKAACAADAARGVYSLVCSLLDRIADGVVTP